MGNGSIIKNDIYLGEVVDGRLVSSLSNWSSPSFAINTSDWVPVALADSQLPSQTIFYAAQPSVTPPTVVYREQPAVDLWSLNETSVVFDMGINAAAGVRLRLRNCSCGTVVSLLYGEILSSAAEGPRAVNPLTAVAGQIKSPGVGGPCAPSVAVQADSHICSGLLGEVFETTFTWHGFRYAQVSISDNTSCRSSSRYHHHQQNKNSSSSIALDFQLGDFIALLLRISVPVTANFTSSSKLLNTYFTA